jgi:TonB family protein
MNRRWFCLVAIAILSCGVGLAQPPSSGAPSSGSSSTLRFEDGAIVNGVYSNECLGFSYPIPAGWQVNGATSGGKAKRLSYKSMGLLFLQPEKGKLPGSRILLTARDAAGEKGTAEDFVTNAVSAQINSPTDHRELVRDTFAVFYGGKHFFRSDYKGVVPDGAPLYFAYIYTEFRGYFIGVTLASGTPEGLDEAAASLHEISFQEDQANPKCSAGVPDEVTSATQPAPPKTATPMHTRISQGISAGLIIKKVQPQYPEDAKQARVQGQVVLQVEISKEGTVRNLQLISGDPMLAPAAIEAVKQWIYKPYLLNGEPVVVETQVIVNFTLSVR